MPRPVHIKIAAKELPRNAWLRTFSDAAARKAETLYANKVDPDKGAGGGCMWAMYDGALAALYGAEWAERFRKEVYRTSLEPGNMNNVDLVMELLEEKGKAGDPWRFAFSGGKWRCQDPSRYQGKNIEEAMLESLKGMNPGWFFFGVSVADGLHSLIVAVEYGIREQKVFWLDQFTKSFEHPRRKTYWGLNTSDVTKKLDSGISRLGAIARERFGDEGETQVWPLYKDFGD